MEDSPQVEQNNPQPQGNEAPPAPVEHDWNAELDQKYFGKEPEQKSDVAPPADVPPSSGESQSAETVPQDIMQQVPQQTPDAGNSQIIRDLQSQVQALTQEKTDARKKQYQEVIDNGFNFSVTEDHFSNMPPEAQAFFKGDPDGVAYFNWALGQMFESYTGYSQQVQEAQQFMSSQSQNPLQVVSSSLMQQNIDPNVFLGQEFAEYSQSTEAQQRDNIYAKLGTENAEYWRAHKEEFAGF